MTIEELYDAFFEGNRLELFEDTKAVFSETLSQEVLEAYEPEELMVEFFSTYKEAKKFEELAEMRELLKEKNEAIFEEVFFHYD